MHPSDLGAFTMFLFADFQTTAFVRLMAERGRFASLAHFVTIFTYGI